MQPLHVLHIERLESVAGGGDEVEAGVHSGGKRKRKKYMWEREYKNTMLENMQNKSCICATTLDMEENVAQEFPSFLKRGAGDLHYLREIIICLGNC